MTKHVLHIEADTVAELVNAALTSAAIASGMVPPSGVEPELPEEPHFECGASTNSAKGAEPSLAEAIAPGNEFLKAFEAESERAYKQPDPTLPHHEQWTAHRAYMRAFFLGDEVGSSVRRTGKRLSQLSFSLSLPNGWLPLFMYDTRGYWYVQITDPNPTCNVTGETMDAWNGRKWLISEHMTDGEIVQTVFKACLTAMEHELRETFRYKGQAIFDPHYDVEKLVELRGREDALAERP